MPRWALVAMLTAFIVPGLFGHDLWPQDASGFGRMWSMAHGTLVDWLLPNVAGAQAPHSGPLPYWVGAILIRAFGGLIGDTNAGAAANLLWYPLAMFSIWQAMFRLARRDEAQPVAGAFGGEANRRDYARLIADISVLLAIGTIGMVWRLHQTQSDSATVAIVAVVLYAASLIEWRIVTASLIAGVAVGAMALTQGPLPSLGLLIGCVAVFVRGARDNGLGAGKLALVLVVLLCVPIVLAGAWPLAAYHWFPSETELFFDTGNSVLATGWPTTDDYAWLGRNGAWFLWPLWPLAAWGVYAWRASLGAAHIERPLLLLAGSLLATLVSTDINERGLVAIIPPMVALAAFGATTLRRALDNVIDWLAIAIFSLALFFLWGYFAAMESGVPKAMAASVTRLTPGFSPHLQFLALLLALAACAAWIELIAWRILRRPRVMWRGPLLAAAGVTVVWIAANLLYLPAVDYIFSYRTFAREVAEQLQARGLGDGCVQAHRIPLAERAIIAYYGRIRFDRAGSSETCRLALHRESRRSTLDNDPPPGVRGMWEQVWEGRRKASPDERWRIWQRVQ